MGEDKRRRVLLRLIRIKKTANRVVRRKKRIVVTSDIGQDAGAGMGQAKASVSVCRRSGKLDIQRDYVHMGKALMRLEWKRDR